MGSGKPRKQPSKEEARESFWKNADKLSRLVDKMRDQFIELSGHDFAKWKISEAKTHIAYDYMTGNDRLVIDILMDPPKSGFVLNHNSMQKARDGLDAADICLNQEGALHVVTSFPANPKIQKRKR